MSLLRNCLIIGFYLIISSIRTQTVFISPEISVKNDFSYYILSHPNETVSLLRDKSFKLSLQTLYPDFQWSQEKFIEIPGKKWRIIEMFENGNDIGIFYISKNEEQYGIFYSIYNSQTQKLSEKELYSAISLSHNDGIKIHASENKQWIGVGFYNLQNEKQFMIYNRTQDSVYYNVNLDAVMEDPTIKFNTFEINNNGIVYLFGRSNENSSSKKKMQALVCFLDASGQKSSIQYIGLDNHSFMDVHIKFDNLNKRLLVGGIYTDKNHRQAKGYLISYFSEDLKTNSNHVVSFTDELLTEWRGSSKKSVLSSSELNTRNIILTRDGGCLIFYENIKELSRRPYFANTDPTNTYPARWYDYYFDDIIVASFDKDGQLSWDKVLHKRQYSQDDEGLFSSFFVFQTPAFLRIIFNDAISSEGTVSEYLLKSDGDNIRKSILNTSYKNLNLRFLDAIELGASSLLIPSENNGRLNLVKIVFN